MTASILIPDVRRRPLAAPLSPQERQVLVAYANGLLAPAIARAMGISYDGVSDARKRAIDKLDARNVTDAVARAWRLGLIDPVEIRQRGR